MSTRTAKSIHNSVVALMMYVINLVLQFFSRKIFLEYLGTEIIGLNTTATNMLQFLNLAELGITNAVAFSLYKPLHEKDINSINDIITLQGHIYKRVALFIIGCASILMLFFPLIFRKMHLPLWYAYMSFGVLLFSSLLGYFINYKQVILTASQQDYKIMYSYKLTMLVKLSFQIFAVWKLDNGYIWWATLEAIFAVIGSIILHKVTIRTFPYLHKSLIPFKGLRRQYKEFEKKIKQLFFHKIGSFALTQTSPLIIYAYANLTLVALYGNYMIIILGLQVLMSSLFNSINAGVGDMLVEDNISKSYNIYRELFSIRFLAIAILCYVAYNLSSTLVSIWIGPEYILPNVTLGLMILTLFFNLLRGTTDSFINGYGLFGDILSPVIEAAINIGFSILLGHFYGLNGIIAGVAISQLIIIYIWKPYYLFSRKLKGYYSKYWRLIVTHIILGIIVWILSDLIISKTFDLIIIEKNDVLSFVFKAVYMSLCYGAILALFLSVLKCGLNQFIERIMSIKNK